MIMVDAPGFVTLLRHLNNEILDKEKKMFVEFFFNKSIPESVKLISDKKKCF